MILPLLVLVTWLEMFLVMACCYRSILNWWGLLTISIFLSIPLRTQRLALKNANVCFIYLGLIGPTMIKSLFLRGAEYSIAMLNPFLLVKKCKLFLELSK